MSPGMETLVFVLLMRSPGSGEVPMTRICPGSRRITRPPPPVVPPEPATMRKDIDRLSPSPPPTTTSPMSTVWLVVRLLGGGSGGVSPGRWAYCHSVESIVSPVARKMKRNGELMPLVTMARPSNSSGTS